jgi:hypothetical protein
MLFQVKFEVQALEKQLKSINAQIYNNQQAIHVLTAEWSHLNEPSRLTELNERYLRLVPIAAGQLARLDDLPPRFKLPSDPAGSELAGGALQALAPAAGPSLPELAPVTRSAPAALAAAEARPTVGGALLHTIDRLLGEGRAESARCPRAVSGRAAASPVRRATPTRARRGRRRWPCSTARRSAGSSSATRACSCWARCSPSPFWRWRCAWSASRCSTMAAASPRWPRPAACRTCP